MAFSWGMVTHPSDRFIVIRMESADLDSVKISMQLAASSRDTRGSRVAFSTVSCPNLFAHA
jgi:hypothetical protein